MRIGRNWSQQTEERVPEAHGRYPCVKYQNDSLKITHTYNVYFPSFMNRVSTLTAQVCMWAWSRDECTAWNERHGRRVQPGSHGTRASRPPGEAGSLCMLQERVGQMKEVSVWLC